MNEDRYIIEVLTAAGPDDAEWVPVNDQVFYHCLMLVKAEARTYIRPTEHGPSGVRVIRETSDGRVDTVWSNC